jgi:glucose-6-phosphate 1-dehydrogenase
VALEAAMSKFEARRPSCGAGRLYYLALPPSVYPMVCRGLKQHCDMIPTAVSEGSWIRVIVEKPFGRDVDSSEELAEELGSLYPESQLYRIDHYLGKEMLQSLFVMRFANALLSPMWSRDSVAAVQITFKEDFGTKGRGGYFDEFGIIRDMIATHLSQILAFVAMEKPTSTHPDDIRDEKLKLLRCVLPAETKNCVLGQYEGYLDDPTVPAGSNTPTYAAITLFIDNDRWAGVPFVIRAGKALNERKTEIRLQLHATPKFIFHGHADEMRNEVVIRLQPDEAMYLKFLVKQPGLEMEPIISELDLDYRRRYPGVVIPDAYSRLMLECLRGDQQHFLRRDELRAAWAIFTPLLHAIDAGAVPVVRYPFGSRGPPEADALLAAAGYIRPKDYEWERRHLGVAHEPMSGIKE